MNPFSILSTILKSSILKKVVMALTGLALVGFLVTHLAGNLQLYMGAAKFNGYARFLEENPLVIIPAELGLLVIFVVHIFLAFKLTFENTAARPHAYAERRTAGESSLSSRSMIWTGLVILVFVVIHVWQFKYGTRPVTILEADGSLWDLAANTFRSPTWVAFYVICMLAMGAHLAHGIGSMFQSLGLRDASGRPRFGGLSALIGWGLALGFAALPLWVYLAKPQASPPSLSPALEGKNK